MLLSKLTEIRADEGGYALVEIMVSAVMLVVVAVGVFSAFDFGTRTAAQERHRARANALAEADLERLRSLPTGTLVGLTTTPQTRTVTQDGFDYTITSSAQVHTETATTSTCSTGAGSRDYLQITSTVTWGSIGSRPPVTVSSIVPSGTLPNSGALLVSIKNSRDLGISGVTVSGGGASSFSGTTGAGGCVLLRNLPAGNYTMSLSGAASGKVDRDGNPPEPETVSVVADSTNTVTLVYDDPGSIPASFRTMKTYGSTALTASQGDSVIVFNNGVPSGLKKFPETPGAPQTTITATSLFPFTSPYAVYAGTCDGDNPDPNGDGSGGQAIANVVVPQGGSQAATLQLPALQATVYRGSNTSSTRASGATFKTWDAKCDFFVRTTTTNSVGRLDDPGYPYSDYFVCAHGTASNGTTRWNWTTASLSNPSNLTSPTAINIFLSGSGSAAGTCP